MRSQRGFIIMDILIGTVIVMVLGGLLTYAVTALNATAGRLQHSRDLLRQEQTMLYAACTGRPLAVPGLHFHRCKPASPRHTLSIPAGYHWALVTAPSDWSAPRLYGLVPDGSPSVQPGGSRP